MSSLSASSGPTRLGGFEIERELGRGGMGVVYLARDPGLERRVALKTLPEDLALDPSRLAQVQREAKLLASLNHPGIAVIHGMGEDERGSRFLVLEWVNGITLAERLQSGRLGFDEGLPLIAQIAEALAAAHQAGVIHRDLKPRNVMVLEGGRVKVLDFGLARRTEGRRTEAIDGQTWIDSGISGLDGSHVLFGTAGYLSPERVLGEPEDARSDIFSFGCVVFECFAGAPAFHGSSVLGVLTRVVKGDPDWSALPDDTPAELRAVLEASLEKSKDKRPATMEEVVRTIERARNRRRGHAPADAPGTATTAHNLPGFLTSFVGRDFETAECLRLLNRTRVLTLVGPGGSGKTRLAVRIAELALGRWPSAWFAGLAAVQDPERLADAAATALGVRLAPGMPALEGLAAWLGDQPRILILDNCEHVVAPAAALVRELLARCPALTVIATSRQELGVAGEQIYAVPTMAVPAAQSAADVAAASRFESVRLFQERAWAADHAFAITAENVQAVVEICRRVDGIPLAIELAAARVRLLAPAEIAARLDQQLRLLRSDAAGDPRHQTLRSTIGWSVDLLPPEEQRSFRLLAVFAGGWTLASATAVLGGGDEFEILDVMGGLVSRSLAVAEHPSGQPSRFRFLEPVRQYALESFAGSADEEPARERHLGFFRDLADAAESGMAGPDQASWGERLELEHENLLAAIDWCARSETRAERAQDLAAAMVKFYYVRGHVPIGQTLFARVLALPGGHGATRGRARALYAAGVLAAFSNDGQERSEPLFTESLAICRAIGDGRMTARSLGALAAVESRRGEHARARAMLEEARAFFRETGDKPGQATTLGNLAAVTWRSGDLPGANHYFDQSRVLLREIGELNTLGQMCIGQSFVAVRLDELDVAAGALREGIDILRRLGARSHNVAGALLAASELATARGRFETAVRLFGASEVLLRDLGLTLDSTDVWWHEHDACVARCRDALGAERCASLWEEGRALSWDRALPLAEESL